MGVEAEKIELPSKALGREFHFDLFTPASGQPEFLFIHFGGSGITRDEYEKRSRGVNPVFAEPLGELQAEFPFALAFYTAPYDLNYPRIEEDDEVAAVWLRHFNDELLPALPILPFFVSGYSGGMSLALAGPQLHERCFGAGGVGSDAVPASLTLKDTFREPVTCVYNLGDRVYTENEAVLKDLSRRGLVRVVRKLPGGHTFRWYLKNQSFQGMIRRAHRLLG